MTAASAPADATTDAANPYKHCTLCPRKCGADRTVAARTSSKQLGFCGETDEVRIAYAGLHFGEEPVITAGTGSGTVFFTGCNLRCPFCQNYQISQCGMGRAVSKDEFVKICLALQSKGASNINLVTASHIVPRIKAYLIAAREAGVTVPYCWNSSAYESVETLSCLKGLVTVWLPDLKTLSLSIAKNLFDDAAYGKVATRSIKWMVSNNPLRFDKSKAGKKRLTSGVIVRHLFLPGRFEETADVLEWLHGNVDGKAIISLMTQYTKVRRHDTREEGAKHRALRSANSDINGVFEDRLVSNAEDTDLREICEAYNFEYLYYQDLPDGSEEGAGGKADSWLPDFGAVDTFPNKLSVPVWHWKTGFIL